MMVEVKFEQVSPADFFYRNRDIAGFTNPSRSLYMSIRELVENSLDAAEIGKILPEIHVQLKVAEDREGDVKIYKLRVEDNGIGIEGDQIPKAFGTVLYGSKYGHRQSRGTFGLGGTMALLYGQITTNKPAIVTSSVGNSEVHTYSLMIDIKENKPRIMNHEVKHNSDSWRGTIVEFYLEADYTNSKAKIIEYFKQTAIANPHATISFVDPKNRFYFYYRVMNSVPDPPKESLPHPVGVDVEMMDRLLKSTRSPNLVTFMTSSFQRVGKKTAEEVINIAGLSPDLRPKKLNHEQVTSLVEAIKKYEKFRAPDPTGLSPIGEDFMRNGIKAVFAPEFIAVTQRQPSSYSGYPFIVESAVAYGGQIPPSESIHIIRFANKIPLLYDERADVTWKVVNEIIDWNNYKVSKGSPLLVVTHICSTKIPYKTVGKEAIADRPEIERELTMAVREAARELKLYLSKVEKRESAIRRLSVYAKYMPKIAKHAAELAEVSKTPDIMNILSKVGVDEELLKQVKIKEEKELQGILEISA